MTKRLSALLVLALFVLTACFGGGANTPQTVVEGFSGAIKDGDIKKAVSYMSDETVENMAGMFDLFIAMAEEDPEAKAEMEEELGISLDELKGMDSRERLATILDNMEDNPFEGQDMDYDFVSEEIDGDHATVTIKTGDGEEDIELVKENGQWKIDISF